MEISSDNSVWSIACSNHVFACLRGTYDQKNWRAPFNGVTVRQAVENGNRVVSFDHEGYPGGNIPCEQ